VTRLSLYLALAGVMSLITFRVTQPMSFRAVTGDTTLVTFHPNQDWVDSIQVAQSESSGIGGGPPGDQWANRPTLVFPFVNMVLWGLGLPLGLMAWAGIAWAAWRCMRKDEEWRTHLIPLTWAAGFFVFMGTRWVMSIRYFLPIYPFMALWAAWGLYEFWKLSEVGEKSEVRSPQSEVENPSSFVLRPSSAFRLPSSVLRLFAGALFLFVTLGTLAWAWGFVSGIYLRDNTRIQASRWIYQNIPAAFNVGFQTAEGGSHREPLPGAEGMQITADAPFTLQFTSPVTGTVTEVTVGHVHNANGEQIPGTLHVVLAADPEGAQVLSQTDIQVEPTSSDPRGGTFTAAFEPAPVQKGMIYFLRFTAPQGGPLVVAGSAVANEAWDEGLPLRLDGHDAFGGLYSGLQIENRWGDDANKLQMFVDNLSRADYLFLPSQRGLWTPTRLVNTYPLTREYYRALFDGRLGFDLVAQFQSPLRLGPLEVSDVGGTLAWGHAPELFLAKDKPFNDNLLAAEEAFSVYDHAPVWIFKKRADFNLDQARTVLAAVDLTKVVAQGPREATIAPTLMMLPPDRLASQRAGGTWSQMFNAESLLNKNEPLGVFVWWLAMLLMGWIAFPLTFVAFGGLADRGYPLAKSVALLFVAWVVRMLGSFQILPYTQLTIALGFGVLAVISALFAVIHRDALMDYLRNNWRYLLTVEAIILALFALDLFIRWGNPDLWHPWKGGEKPMDFSYFNAILKSTSFPPYDPWLAGGYINYYYYGFVIVGLLTKLLGIVPSFAYNLILPMLFSLLGINAFCVAYNLVKKTEVQSPKSEVGSPMSEVQSPESEVTTNDQLLATSDQLLATSDQPPATSDQPPATNDQPPAPSDQPPAPNPRSRIPNPYLAGIAAALFIVVFGNLGQVQTVVNGLKAQADHAALASSMLGDNDMTALINGTWRVLTNKDISLQVGIDSWYWDASRIIPPGEGEAGPITEFPFFTFLYADMHAHMIDLPFTVLALAWAVAYLQGIKRRRGWLDSAALWFIGGLAFGVTRPTNTWDFPVYLALGAIAVFVANLEDFRLTRPNLVAASWRTLLFVGLVVLLYQPYAHWYASGYDKAEMWKGGKSTVTGYLYVHGLFFFTLITFMVWETRRWLAETPASVLNQAKEWGGALVFALLIFAVCVGAFLYLKIVVAPLALFLMAWAGLLILRSSDAMPIEKRIVLMLLGTGLALTLVVEVVVLQGDISRMNTVFKFYLQVWTLFSIAAAAALAWVWPAINVEWQPKWGGVWTTGLMLLVASAALYTVTGGSAKMRDRIPAMSIPTPGCELLPNMPDPYENNRTTPDDLPHTLGPSEQPHSLNGMDHLQWAGYCDRGYFLPLKYDYDAMRWMQDNVQGSPVIAEAQSFDLYRLSSRYAWFTGLPDVVGWDWHQRQQRAAMPTESITQRGNEVTNFYLNPDPNQVGDFLKKYDVRYIIVGPMEQAYYFPSGGLAKFEAMVARGQLAVAYQNPGVTIYQVVQ
jgi:YYY domain-containing protein